MFKVRISEVRASSPYRGDDLPEGSPTREIVILEQELEKLDLRAVLDVLNPPKRSHTRRKQP